MKNNLTEKEKKETKQILAGFVILTITGIAMYYLFKWQAWFYEWFYRIFNIRFDRKSSLLNLFTKLIIT